jgi:broad specificity phosphatase PhoE
MKAFTRFFAALILVFCGRLIAVDSPNVVIIRHGEGEHNHLHLYSSWTKSEGGVDHCLTEVGKQQVATTAQSLLSQGFNKETVGLVLVSPMMRTHETAQILVDHGVCSQDVVMMEELIREPVAKDCEGAPTPPKRPNEDRWTAIVNASAQHGGETVEAIYQRIEKVFDRLSNWDRSKGHVILVTHGFPSQTLFKIYNERGVIHEPNILLNTAEAKVVPFPGKK